MAISDAVISNLTTLYLGIIAAIKAYALVFGRNYSGGFVLILSTALVGLILIGTLMWDVSRKATYALSRDPVDEICRGGICWHGVAVKSPASQVLYQILEPGTDTGVASTHSMYIIDIVEKRAKGQSNAIRNCIILVDKACKLQVAKIWAVMEKACAVFPRHDGWHILALGGAVVLVNTTVTAVPIPRPRSKWDLWENGLSFLLVNMTLDAINVFMRSGLLKFHSIVMQQRLYC
ncbi:hypothetical protein RJ641_032482 [Dillenia turbinata]|uniref:Uncharacterized protein n=1 Tax=Dillenia turbinata TaxID=194707 RepID=A0AAN8VWC0_9MAGN